MLGNGVNQIDVRFDILWRSGPAGIDGGSETTLATFSHPFVRRVAGGFLATPYFARAAGPAAPAAAGDQLILRITPTAGDPGALFVPNGDGPRGQGAFPRIDLPQ